MPADPSLKAESRWQGDEDDASLTWGNLMTGDSFFDRVEEHFHFSDEVRVVEIGPGYGRLLRTMLQRNYPFRSFLGLDLSEARITKLRRQFFDSSVQFEVGNCSNFKFDGPFDLGLSSATFEHLFPSIEQALMNFRSNMNSGGMLFIDFIRQDEVLAVSKAYFEPDSAGGAYIRIYSRQELDRFFTQAGFVVEAVHPIVLGKGAQGEPINRALVCATAR
jgi:SAM-dependent methyltransferase